MRTDSEQGPSPGNEMELFNAIIHSASDSDDSSAEPHKNGHVNLQDAAAAATSTRACLLRFE